MDDATYQVIAVGGGIGGSAAALRAAQHGLRTAWIRGDASTARASRAKYVYNVDNMIGVHPGIVMRKILDLLRGDEHAPARSLLEKTHLHISTQDIMDDVLERVRSGFPDQVTAIDEKAVEARRDGDLFVVVTGGGRTVRGRAVVISTGVMDRQPKVKRMLKSGKVVDDIRWIFPYANHETLLYCVICEGHLTRSTPTAVLGSGEGAAQVALMLHERYAVPVRLLTNGEPLEVKGETRVLLSAYGIDVLPARVVEILDGEAGPKGKSLRGFALEDGVQVEARFAVVALGLHRVYTDLARQLSDELEGDGADDERHVLVSEASSETSVPNLFAVGDMTRRRGEAPSLKQIYTAQEFAVRAIQTIDRRLRRERRSAILAANGS